MSARSDVFSWYSLIGMTGQALGTIVSGSIIEILEAQDGWTTTHAYRIIFFGYGVIGVFKLVLSLMLSRACEVSTKSDTSETQTNASVTTSENSRLLPNDRKTDVQRSSWRDVWSARKESLAILGKVSFLLALEAIATGLLVT